MKLRIKVNNIRFMKKLVHVKATMDRKAHTRNVKSEIDKINKIYNRLCQEMNITPQFIGDIGRLKQKVEELKIKASRNPGSLYYLT